MQSILTELIKEEKTKEFDPAIATFAFFGMVHYTVKWYHKDSPVPLDQLAQMFIEIFNTGILR